MDVAWEHALNSSDVQGLRFGLPLQDMGSGFGAQDS